MRTLAVLYAVTFSRGSRSLGPEPEEVGAGSAKTGAPESLESCAKTLNPKNVCAQATVMMALLQPSPQVYALFDEVLLLSEGMCVFHGPRADVLPFFEGVGFAPPPRMDVPGFLQNITSHRDQQVWETRPVCCTFPLYHAAPWILRFPRGSLVVQSTRISLVLEHVTCRAKLRVRKTAWGNILQNSHIM